MAIFNLDERPPEDGLPDRDAGSWAAVKLGIIRCYLEAFVVASTTAPHRQYAEGFSGPGINLIRESGTRLWGSPMISLSVEPVFDRCLFMDTGQSNVEALASRTEQFRDRAHVRQGDCNKDIVTEMQSRFDKTSPTLCLLDPEGAELAWQTVESIAAYKTSKWKAEQLILLATDTGFTRLLFLHAPLERWAEERVTALFGNERWRQTFERRRAGAITADEARTEYVQLYTEGLRNLGYANVLERPVQAAPGGRILYFLVFATDHDAGARIMDHCFDNVWGEAQQSLPGIKAPRRRRIV
ncbi:MAG: three-Cys-motif partner protein TcmP [Actinomycetota bacterium]